MDTPMWSQPEGVTALWLCFPVTKLKTKFSPQGFFYETEIWLQLKVCLKKKKNNLHIHLDNSKGKVEVIKK